MQQPSRGSGDTMSELIGNAFIHGTEVDFTRLSVGNETYASQLVIEKLDGLLSGSRKDRIEKVLDRKTFNVATVVEGLVNTGNVSAVMRTAESLGFQPFHIINNGLKFKHSKRISHGAEKWLSTWHWNEPISCVNFLKEQGYRVIATTVNDQAEPLENFDFMNPTALVFGNEAEGVTHNMLKAADQTCYIPMAGFTQSLNISVAAAITLYHIQRQRITKNGYQGDLTSEQRQYLKAIFYYQSINNRDRVFKKLADR